MSSGRLISRSSANRVESRKRDLRDSSDEAPQSEASMVKAPKHEAEGVTIKPLESRRVNASLSCSLAPPGKSPALAAIRPQHHWSLGNPTLYPAVSAICRR